MRTKPALLVAAPLALAASLATLALAQDAKPAAKKRLELAYRWDLLDGKTAVYDAELVSVVQVERQATTEREDAGGESADAAPEKLEATTTTNQRLTMTFEKDEGGRGRVRIVTEKLKVSLQQVALGATESISYDSESPPKEGIPEKLRATVQAILGKPYTLVVGRRGTVEAVEGRPAEQVEGLKGTFLVFPDKPKAEGESWTQALRQPSPPYGEFVTKITCKLAKAVEGADSASSRLSVDARILTSLDDGRSTLPPAVIARVEDAKGEGHMELDGRGLKVSEETSSQYAFVVKQVALVQTNRFENRSKWKLVEVR